MQKILSVFKFYNKDYKARRLHPLFILVLIAIIILAPFYAIFVDLPEKVKETFEDMRNWTVWW